MNNIKIGDLVKVGPSYQMADHPPFIGRGTFRADQWTDKVYRVVALRPGKLCPPSAALAPANLLNVDESDEVVDIVLTRLTKV